MQASAFRLHPGVDLRKELLRFAQQHRIEAACVLSCVGSLSAAIVRMPGARVVRTYDEPLEIVSLVGTLSADSEHLHISFSRLDGQCLGGHVEDGCIVRTTAEVVIGQLPYLSFQRRLDENTGFPELIIEDHRNL